MPIGNKEDKEGISSAERYDPFPNSGGMRQGFKSFKTAGVGEEARSPYLSFHEVIGKLLGVTLKKDKLGTDRSNSMSFLAKPD